MVFKPVMLFYKRSEFVLLIVCKKGCFVQTVTRIIIIILNLTKNQHFDLRLEKQVERKIAQLMIPRGYNENLCSRS